MRKITAFKLMVVGLMFFVVISCGRKLAIRGAGTGTVQDLYTSWFSKYYKATGVKVNYDFIGCIGGRNQISNQVVDFGSSILPYTDTEIEQIKAEMGNELIHIPTSFSAVAIVYNLGLFKVAQLNLDANTIAAIFIGQITNWNDARIAALNPGMSLPDKPIVVIYRSDPHGTTFAFSDFLAKESQSWKKLMGEGAYKLNWKVGRGIKGDYDMAYEVLNTDGAIGYLDLYHASDTGLHYAAIKNKSGNFILPTVGSISLAANMNIPWHTRLIITDTAASKGYPIASFAWVLLYKEQNYGNRTKNQAQALVDFIWWMIHDGQQYAVPINYAPLPENVVKKAENLLKSVTYDGVPIKL